MSNCDEYEDWLRETDIEDSEEAREWFDCPEEDRAQWIDDHEEWWNNW